MRNRPALSHAVVSACLWFAALPALAADPLPKGLLALME